MAAKQTDTPEPNALERQNAQLLDLVVELEERLSRVEAGTATVAAKQETETEAYRAKMDAEMAVLKAEFKDFPLIEQVTRRAELGTEAASEIRLVDEPSLTEDPKGVGRKWALRWFNFAKDGRAQEAGDRGWEKVPWTDVRDSESMSSGVKNDPYVRKGDRGLEVLHRTPKALYDYLKRREQAKREGRLGSESQMRDHIASRVSHMAGQVGDNVDQAGSFVAGKGFQITATPQATERFTA